MGATDPASRSTTTCVIGTSKRSRARADDVALEPVRAAFGVRRDDDLVRTEGAQRVLDRLERVAVADLAPAVDAVTLGAAPGSRRAGAARPRAPRPRPTPSAAPVSSAQGRRRAPGRSPPRALLRRIAELRPPTVSFATTRIRCSSSAPTSPDVRRGGSSERDRIHNHTAVALRATNTTSPSHVDRRRHDDQREVRHRQQEEAVCLGSLRNGFRHRASVLSPVSDVAAAS